MSKEGTVVRREHSPLGRYSEGDDIFTKSHLEVLNSAQFSPFQYCVITTAVVFELVEQLKHFQKL